MGLGTARPERSAAFRPRGGTEGLTCEKINGVSLKTHKGCTSPKLKRNQATELGRFDAWACRETPPRWVGAWCWICGRTEAGKATPRATAVPRSQAMNYAIRALIVRMRSRGFFSSECVSFSPTP